MTYLDWNIKCSCNIEKIISLIDSKKQDHDCIIALQEVKPNRAEKLIEHYSDSFSIVYSLDYRKPDEEFDTDNRRLGIMLLVSKDYSVEECGVFERCLFPERTLYATLSKEGKTTKVVTLHSITGVSFKMGKAVQFRSFAECIRDYQPDILSMDANEPRVDHYDIDGMVFFNQGEKTEAARLFFNEIRKQGLVDSYVVSHDVSGNDPMPGRPLVTSHIINGKAHRRYDFVFVKSDREVQAEEYLYDEAVTASSDHALIEVKIK